jgi:PmbA protein
MMHSPVEASQSLLKDLPSQIVQRGLKAGATDVVGQVEIEKRRMVRFSNNSITVTKTWDVVSPFIYLGFGKRSIASRLGDTSMATVDKTIAEMLPAVKALPDTVESHIPKGPFSYKEIQGIYDSRIPNLEGELTDKVESAINASLAEGARRVSGVLSSYHTQKALKTSAGAEASSEQTLIEISLRSFAEDDASGQGISVSTTLGEFDPAEAGTESGKLAKQSLHPQEGKEGKYNVVFGPSIFSNLINTTAFSASAYGIEAGFSYFADKLGRKVGSEKLTLTDDRLRPRAPGSVPFDDEGHPAQTNQLIERGVLKTVNHDSRTAAKFKSRSTGNAVYASDIGQIIPIATCLVLDEGKTSKDEVIEEAKDGLYITNNWYTRFQNYRQGDFSTIPRDAMFQIQNGRLGSPVKGLRVSDNMIRILESIRAVSNERKWIRWWEVDIPTYLGHFLVDQVGITRSTS